MEAFSFNLGLGNHLGLSFEERKKENLCHNGQSQDWPLRIMVHRVISRVPFSQFLRWYSQQLQWN